MTTGVRSPRTRSWWHQNAVAVAALVFIAAGAAVLLLAPTTVPAFGWTAYTPLSSGSDFADYARKSYLTEQHLIGAGIAVLGLIMLAGAVGYRVGSRRRTGSRGL